MIPTWLVTIRPVGQTSRVAVALTWWAVVEKPVLGTHVFVEYVSTFPRTDIVKELLVPDIERVNIDISGAPAAILVSNARRTIRVFSRAIS